MKISFLIPTFNEKKYINSLLKNLKKISSSDYQLEILVIDGESNDGTPEIVKKTCKELNSKNFKIKLLNNPLRLQGEALNIGLANASNEFCVRIDSHLKIGSKKSIRSSLKSSINLLKSNKTCSVGFKQRFSISSNIIQNSLYWLSLSPYLSGLRKYRLALSNQYSNTSVWLFSVLKSKAINSGGFISEETPNEDMGFNERLCKFTNSPLYLDINFPIYYLPRKSFKSLFIQYYRYALARSKRRLKEKNQIKNTYPYIRSLVFLISIIFNIFLFTNYKLILVFYLFLFFCSAIQIKFDALNFFNTNTLNKKETFSLLQSFLITPLTFLVVLMGSFTGSIKAIFLANSKK